MARPSVVSHPARNLPGKTVTVDIKGTDDYQLDGDVLGRCHQISATVQPGALSVRVA